MFIKFLKNYKYLYFISPVILYLLLFSNYFFGDNFLFGFAEWYSPYSVSHLNNFLFNGGFLYSDTNWGIPSFYPTINIFYLLFYSLSLLFNLAVAQKIIILGVFYFNFLGSYLLLKEFCKNLNFSYVFALLFSLNPFILNHLVHGHLVLLISSAQLLFFGYFAMRYFNDLGRYNLVLAILFFAINPIHPLYIPFYFLFFLLLATYKNVKIKKIIKLLSLVLISFCLLNATWILNLITNDVAIGNIMEYRSFTLESLKTQSQPLINSFLNFEYVNKNLFLNNNLMSQFLFNLSTLLCWGVLFIVLMSKRLIEKSKKKFYFGMLFFILIFMFMLSGFFNPIGNPISHLLIKLKVYQFYREIYHFTFILIPLFFVLLSFLSVRLNKNVKKIIFFILVLSLVLKILSLFTYSTTNTISNKIYSWNSQQLTENEEAYNLIYSKYKTGEYILFVPFYYNTYDKRMNASDKEGGADSFLISNCVSTIGNWLPLNYPYQKIISSFDKNTSTRNTFSNLGIKYVVFRKNFASSVEQLYNTEELKKKIKKDSNFMLVEKNIFFEIYENGYNSGMINSNNLLFKKINPTKYKLYIKELKNSQDLYFLQSYSKAWKIYPKSNPTNAWCSKNKYYNQSNTTECEYAQEYFQGNELSYFTANSISDDSHRIGYDYANLWTIDPEYIKQSFSKEYYIENPDGSIDVELVLYFKPQSYFYLGLIVSGITLFGYFGYLIYDWQKRKSVNLIKKR